MENIFSFKPIGFFGQSGAEKANCPVQPDLKVDRRVGWIELAPNYRNSDMMDGYAIGDLIWLLFAFHQVDGWKPKVLPPRWTDRKVGVLATRSPYRPNPIGLSCVKLHDISDVRIEVVGADLIDGTPILDIKPYLAYTDAHSEQHPDWYRPGPEYQLHVTPYAEEQMQFLDETGEAIRAACEKNLRYPPLVDTRKRIKECGSRLYELSYRTWRIAFELTKPDTIHIASLRSGYTPDDLDSHEDPYDDMDIHRKFIATFKK